MEAIFNWDMSILLYIQEHLRNDVLTLLFKAYTNLGNAGIICIIMSIALMIPKKTRNTGILCGISLLISFIINNLILKNAFHRTRPYLMIEGLELLVNPAKDFSFPSGHTASFFSTMVIIFLREKKIYGIPAIISAFLMGFSRLYVGVHYPTDVIAAAFSATLIAAVVFIIYKKFFMEKYDDFWLKSKDLVN